MDLIHGAGSSKPETAGTSTGPEPSYHLPTMHCRIRLAETTDYPAACRLYAEADALHARERPDRFRPTDQPARSRRLFERHLADPDQALFLAEVDGAVVGLVRVQALERLEVPDVPALTPRRYAMVQELVVAQTHQRRGIATRLMTEAHRWARDRGLTQVELSVYDFNHPALRLYEKLGFTPRQPPTFPSNLTSARTHKLLGIRTRAVSGAATPGQCPRSFGKRLDL